MSHSTRHRSARSRRHVLGALGTTVVATVGCAAETSGTDDEIEPTFDHPDTVPIDEPFALEIGGLPPDTDVEVVATVDDGRGVSWSASATYDVTNGTINLDADVPIAGDYDVADTMRLIQHMEPATDSRAPYVPRPEERLSVAVAIDEDVVGSTTITRPFGDSGVTATEFDHERLVGEAFEPPGTEPAPAVVALHGSRGEPATGMARLLASNGFVALALQYFGADGLPSELVEVPVEFVDEAASWLLEHDRVAGSQVGLIGGSKGGELALLAGSQFDSIGAVVGISASGVVWEGVSMTDVSPGPSWTLGGEPVPYVPYTDDQSVWDRRPPLELEPVYAASFDAASDEEIDDATIPVEEIDGPVLLVSGGADRLWNAVELSAVAIDRLEAHGHDAEYDHLVFEDAGHGIQFPYVPTANRRVIQPYVLGGTPAGYAKADAEHWPRALETLRRS